MMCWVLTGRNKCKKLSEIHTETHSTVLLLIFCISFRAVNATITPSTLHEFKLGEPEISQTKDDIRYFFDDRFEASFLCCGMTTLDTCVLDGH